MFNAVGFEQFFLIHSLSLDCVVNCSRESQRMASEGNSADLRLGKWRVRVPAGADWRQEDIRQPSFTRPLGLSRVHHCPSLM